MTTTPIPVVTKWGEKGLLYIGTDQQGIELEVITVKRGSNEMVVHSMPTSYRHERN